MSARHMLMLFILGYLLFFTALGNHQLQGSTEPRVAGIAMEMHLDNDWVTPRLNGMPFLEKPPLSLWLDAGAIKLFGATTWSVRLASATAGLLTLMLLFSALCRLGRPVTVAASAVVLLATMASFWVNVRSVGEDALLSLGVSLALLSFFLASRQRTGHGAPFVREWLWFALGIAIATLSKGVLGLALPGAVIFCYLVAESLLSKRFILSAWLWPAAMTLGGLLPLAVWLGFLYQSGGLPALTEVLWANSVGRFSGGFQDAGHFEPFYYYLGKLPQAFLPWNLLVYFGLWHFRKQLLANRYLLFFSLWLLAQMTLLTFASSKRMVYLMALTPAAAVIASEFGAVLLQRLRERSPMWAKHQRASIFGGLAVVISVYMVVAIWVMPMDDQKQSFLPLTDEIRRLEAAGQEVVLFTPSERLAGAGVFYSQSLLRSVQSEAQLNQFLSQSAGNVAVIELQQQPVAPLKVIKAVVVGDRSYYFVVH